MTPPRAVLCVVAALLGCGCGAAPAPGPRPAVAALLRNLAAGDVTAVCASLTPTAAAELAVAFGGTSCPQTVGSAARYVRLRAGERDAVADARILPAMDLPLSPAPYDDGDTTARVRVSFHDPVLGQLQLFDVTVLRAHGEWKVSSGIAALFTLLTPG